MPSGKLWKNYSILYVQTETPDFEIKKALEESKINEFVSLKDQYIPSLFSESSIQIALLKLGYNKLSNEYLTKRKSFFYDKSQRYRIYYIPNSYKSQISECEKLLEKKGIFFGTDSKASYPWIIPISGIIVFAILLLFTKNKMPFCVGSVIPLIFLYCNPFYPVALSAFLILLWLFFASNLWKRKGYIKYLFCNKLFLIMIFVSIVAVFSASILTGFMTIAVAAGSAGAIYTYSFLEQKIRNKKPFVPVFIRPAKRISVFAGRQNESMTVINAFSILMIIVLFLTSSGMIKGGNTKLQLPSVHGLSDNSLPVMDDYYKWSWSLQTAPYTSLNEKNISPEEGATVIFYDYSEDEKNGFINKSKKQITYNNAFRKNVLDNIDSLQFNAIEKVMKEEGINNTYGFSTLNSYQINIFGIIMCFICLFVLLFIHISIIIRKGINK